MILKGGTRYYDTPVGVLCLDSLFPKPRGHLRNPLTFGFPVVTRVITGVDVPRLLFNPTPELLEPFVQAARELEADGVRAVTGSCGFMARFQGQIARERGAHSGHGRAARIPGNHIGKQATRF